MDGNDCAPVIGCVIGFRFVVWESLLLFAGVFATFENFVAAAERNVFGLSNCCVFFGGASFSGPKNGPPRCHWCRISTWQYPHCGRPCRCHCGTCTPHSCSRCHQVGCQHPCQNVATQQPRSCLAMIVQLAFLLSCSTCRRRRWRLPNEIHLKACCPQVSENHPCCSTCWTCNDVVDVDQHDAIDMLSSLTDKGTIGCKTEVGLEDRVPVLLLLRFAIVNEDPDQAASWRSPTQRWPSSYLANPFPRTDHGVLAWSWRMNPPPAS